MPPVTLGLIGPILTEHDLDLMSLVIGPMQPDRVMCTEEDHPMVAPWALANGWPCTAVADLDFHFVEKVSLAIAREPGKAVTLLRCLNKPVIILPRRIPERRGFA